MRPFFIIVWTSTVLLVASHVLAVERDTAAPSSQPSTGWVIVHEVLLGVPGMPAAPQRQTMSVSGPKVRIDAGEAMSTVVDHETNERFGLLHEMKVVVHEPFKDAEENKKRGSEKGAGASTRAANDGAAKEAETLTKPTGRKQKINGFDVEEYVPTKVDSRAKRFWVTKEMKDEFALRAALTSGYAGSSDFRPMRSVLAALPGVAVRLEFETAAGWKTTATFVSAEQQEVDPAIFEVPEGYTEMKP